MERLYYHFIRVAMKLRLFVLDYRMEEGFGADDGTMVCVIEGRWRWQKRSA